MAILPGQARNKPKNGSPKSSGSRFLGHRASSPFRQKPSGSMYMEKKSQNAMQCSTAISPTSPSHSSKRSFGGMFDQHLRSPSSNASTSVLSSFAPSSSLAPKISPGVCSTSSNSYLRRRRGSKQESKERRNSIQDSLRKFLDDEGDIDFDMFCGQEKLDGDLSCNSSLSSWNSTSAKFGDWKRPASAMPRRRSSIESSSSSSKARVSDNMRRRKRKLRCDGKAWIQSSCSVSNITLPFDNETGDLGTSTRTPCTPQKADECGETDTRIGMCTPISKTHTVTPQSSVSLTLRDLKIPQLFGDSDDSNDNEISGPENRTKDLQESFGSLSLNDESRIFKDAQLKSHSLHQTSSAPVNGVLMVPPFCSEAFNETMTYQDSPDLSSLIGHMQVVQTLDALMKPPADASVVAIGSFPDVSKLTKHRRAQVRWQLLEAAGTVSTDFSLCNSTMTSDGSDAIESLRKQYGLHDDDIKTIVNH